MLKNQIIHKQSVLLLGWHTILNSSDFFLVYFIVSTSLILCMKAANYCLGTKVNQFQIFSLIARFEKICFCVVYLMHHL